MTSTSTLCPTNGGVVSTLAGQYLGFQNGTGTAAWFNAPLGVAVDSTGNIYVADSNNNMIREIGPGGVVSTFAGQAGVTGSTNGPASITSFNNPLGVAVDSSGNIFVTDSGNNLIRKISPEGVVTSFAHVGNLCAGIAVDSSGNVYVTEENGDAIDKITPGGVVTTLAGSRGHHGSANGTGTAASFNQPMGVAADSSGNVYVADAGNNLIREISPGGVVTTLAGSGAFGSTNGTGTAASFASPEGVAVDFCGNVYVCDSSNNLIREITPSGEVSTLAGSGSLGTANGTGSAASFGGPWGIVVNSSETIYVADTNNELIREIQ